MLKVVCMKNKSTEIIILRSIACISVLLIHSITKNPANFESESTLELFLAYLQLLLMYGTPMFVFISEFVIAYNYQDKLPNNFMLKRIKFILLPFIFMGIFYAITSNYEDGLHSILVQATRNVILGDYHGYFILIIFQFYFLHMIFKKVEKYFSLRTVMFFSVLINFVYLGFFNFVEPFDIPNVDTEYIWYRYSWIPFPGWIAFFFMGYYAGAHYESFKDWLAKHPKKILYSWVLTGTMIILFQKYNIITDISSKRIDIFLFTISTILLFFYIASNVTLIPKFLKLINRYSFGIYLLHPFLLDTVSVFILGAIPQIDTVLGSLFINFFVGLLLPIPIVFLLNKLKFGPYIVGKVAPKLKKSTQLPKYRAYTGSPREY
ncbi:hypothetical protein DN389_10665 [Bacillus sp. AY3-1]|nr:hypothetical protein DN389_10665 [Bacillus sp. AY3-1]